MDTGSEAAASLPPPSWRIIPILALAGAVGLMASSIYIPSIPTIAGDLGAGIGAVQLTVTVFLVVFASGMLIHGPLSDRYGRKPVMIAGLAVGAAGSFGCALSPGVEWLLLFRIVQAAGIGTGMTVGRAVVRDIFSAEGAQRPMSALAVVSGLAPATAPSLGGAIEVALGWRWQFLLVAIVCVALCLVIAFGVAESNRAPVRDRSIFGGMFGSFRILLGSRTFLFYVGTVAFGSACYYVYVVGAPVVLAGKFQLRPDVIGIYAGFPPMGFMAVSVFMARFAHKLSIDNTRHARVSAGSRA